MKALGNTNSIQEPSDSQLSVSKWSQMALLRMDQINLRTVYSFNVTGFYERRLSPQFIKNNFAFLLSSSSLPYEFKRY
jgi:hypothetical protein